MKHKTLYILLPLIVLLSLDACNTPGIDEQFCNEMEREVAVRNCRNYQTKRRWNNIHRKLSVRSLENLRSGCISPFDSIFMEHARDLGWDWTLLASLAYQESHFIDTIRSRSGACGLMGIMPRTAVALDIPMEEIFHPGINVRTGVEVLRRFRKGFSHVSDSLQLVKFTLAAYNAGLGHIQDACRLAEKYGDSPDVWDGSVSYYILLKSDSVYYTDSLCIFGHLNGRRVYRYVREVLEREKYYKFRIDN
ncbi:MAG: transglycosylase SLT domain-containing protein [Tannerellaceae bacterium]|jgi:membrane-bound lytic murein transglycosylase F|nr:transglycosylase SLT domain-containing protein [Tannerellaceae bacterium]